MSDGIIYILLQTAKKMCAEVVNDTNPIIPHLVSFKKADNSILLFCANDFFKDIEGKDIFGSGLRQLRIGKVPYVLVTEGFTLVTPEGIEDHKKWRAREMKKYGEIKNHPDAKDYVLLKCFDGQDQSTIVAPILTTDEQRNIGEWITVERSEGRFDDD